MASDDDERLERAAAFFPSHRHLAGVLAAFAEKEIARLTQVIDVVFDGPPGPEAGRFIEVEDADGKSISIGEWITRLDGWCVLRLKAFTKEHAP